MTYTDSESEMFPSRADWKSSSGYGGLTLLHYGSYADVYRAQKDGKYFLLKIAREDRPEFTDILKREYEISVGLDHPNIVNAFSFENLGGGGKAIVMEYVDGKNLSEFLCGKASVRERKKILNQLLSAVSYLHSKGIIHNDIKPGNIIISNRDSNLKLIDFGLSDDDAHYLARTLGCTPDFASPELLTGQKNPDERSDVYSIGRIIGLLFPKRYALIVRKCTALDKSRRFRNVEAIRRSISAGRTVNWIVGTLAAVCILTAPELSHILRQRIYDAAQKQAEMSDNKVREQCCRRLDSLYAAYETRIRREHYQLFGSYDISDFSKEMESIRDEGVRNMNIIASRDRFLAYCRQRWEKERDLLAEIVATLPDFTGMPPEEIDFYLDLATSGKPYRPFGN